MVPILKYLVDDKVQPASARAPGIGFGFKGRGAVLPNLRADRPSISTRGRFPIDRRFGIVAILAEVSLSILQRDRLRIFGIALR